MFKPPPITEGLQRTKRLLRDMWRQETELILNAQCDNINHRVRKDMALAEKCVSNKVLMEWDEKNSNVALLLQIIGDGFLYIGSSELL